MRETVTLTPGGFPDLLATAGGDPESPRSAAADLSCGAPRGPKDAADRLLDDILDDVDVDDDDDDDDDAASDSASDAAAVEEEDEDEDYRDLQARRATRSRRESPSPPAFHHDDAVAGEPDLAEEAVAELQDEFDRRVVESMKQEVQELDGDDYDGADEDSYYDDEEDVGGDDEEASTAKSEDSVTIVDLLERAHDRLHMQDLHDEVASLKKVIERKNVELENLTGQLRRAVATKCDLVLAHTELELHHEHNLRKKEQGLRELGKVNRGLLEEQSFVELELLNEMALLTRRMAEQTEAHRREVEKLEEHHQKVLDERDRKHRDELRLKTVHMAKLQEEIRCLKGLAPEPAAPKKAGGGLLSFMPLAKQ